MNSGGAVIRHATPFRFERDRLAELARQYAAEFRGNGPFPHVLIRNFLPEDVAINLAMEFPRPDDIGWLLEGPGDALHSKDKNIEKISSSDEEMFPPLIRHVMHEFNSGTFVDFVSQLTGFESLMPDPWFGGCGLHSTGRGGRLMVHADASRHPNPKLHQILNMIYYVTPEWQEKWGGQLELWDRDAKACVKTVTPEFNSMLIFFTGSRCYHGHPHPITSPVGTRRNSMAAYYYTTDRAIDETYDGHQTSVTWIRTTEIDKKVSMRRRARDLLRKILPAPIGRIVESTITKRRA